MQSEQICLEVQWHLFGSLCWVLVPHSLMLCGKFPTSVLWLGEFPLAAYSGTNVLLSILRICPLKLGSWSGLAFLVVPAIKPVCFGLMAQRCTIIWFLIQSMDLSLCGQRNSLIWLSWVGLIQQALALVLDSGATIYLTCVLWKSLLAQVGRVQNAVPFPNSPWSYDLTKFILREFCCKPTEWNWQIILSSLRVISSVIYVKVCVAEYVERLFLTFLPWINDAFWMAGYTSSQVAQIFPM